MSTATIVLSGLGYLGEESSRTDKSGTAIHKQSA